jgi:glycosyltransferase involved in cell wall biosynthesis
MAPEATPVTGESGESISPLVTVGIPTYNRPSELERAARSVLMQDHERLEVIISDNGSADADARRTASAWPPQIPGFGLSATIRTGVTSSTSGAYRKSEVGMFEQAAADLRLDLGTSAMVGDSPSDMEASRRIGTVRVLAGGADVPEVDYVARDLDDAARWLLRRPA